MIKLKPHQREILSKLDSGSILKGGVGSGKSLTALAYYFENECGGKLDVDNPGIIDLMTNPKPLYIITTALKRDKLEWNGECAHFLLSPDPNYSLFGTPVIIDSWNNIKKYKQVKDAFFIFDEQRLVGTGAWTKSFYKIAQKNNWLLLTATPGDVWNDYAPVFIANGFYKDITQFRREHVIYSYYSKYPKIEGYRNVDKLMRYRRKILINMDYKKHTVRHPKYINCNYDVEMFDTVLKKRWNPYENKPVKDVSELYRLMRKVVASDSSRIEQILTLYKKHKKLIIFYNFDYELDILRSLVGIVDAAVAEYNGHNHDPIPNTDRWIYLVNYKAGSEGWNCTQTDTIIFYSLNYSYKAMEQSCGRIDRMNTPFTDLYYYYLRSKSWIDLSIWKALESKRNFHETKI
jgi:hypothetical protein